MSIPVPNSTPFIPGAYRSVNAIFATANTDQSGASGTAPTVYTPPASGAGNPAYVYDVTVSVPGTSAAAVVVVLISDGTNLVLAKAIPVLAVTPSATLGCFTVRVPIDQYIPAGGLMKILTTIAQSTHALFRIADY